MFKPETKTVPARPGVYWFLQDRQVIYVGKAKNLKNRLSSYRRLAGIDLKTKLMLESATGLKWRQLDSEIEAIMTEARLISLYRPRYNVILKDDKSPLYLTITPEKFPRLILTRGRGSFGPFTSARVLRQILERLRPIFPYCESPQAGRACFYYHLQLCPGACIGRVSQVQYRRQINHLRLFFQNRKKRLLASLKQQMTTAAKAQNFLLAGRIKNQLEALSGFWQARLLTPELPRLSDGQINLELQQLFKIPVCRIETYDISNLSGTNPSGGMVVAVNGRIDKKEYRLFNIKNLKTPNDPAMMAQMLRRRFHHSEWPRPDLVLVDGGLTQIRAVKKVIPQSILVVGLAKKPDRLVFDIRPKKNFLLAPASAAARLLIQLRDEAHRFGRKQHLKLRSKSLLQPFA